MCKYSLTSVICCFWLLWSTIARYIANKYTCLSQKDIRPIKVYTHCTHMRPHTDTHMVIPLSHLAAHPHAHSCTLYLLLSHTLTEEALRYEHVNVLAGVPVRVKLFCWIPIAWGHKRYQAKLWLQLRSNTATIITFLSSSLQLSPFFRS